MKNYDAIPQIDWARLAAYIDGEGCMSIAKGHVKKDQICHVYTLQVCVVNTNPSILLWIYDNFGGWLYPKRVSNPEKHTQSYTWVVTGKIAETIISHCMEFFLAKKMQACLVLQFRETYKIDRSSFEYERDSNGRNFLGGTPRFGGIEVDEKRDAYRNELKRLKRVFPPQDIERIQEIIQ